MLQALSRLFRPGTDTAQLELGINGFAPRDAAELLTRLQQLGLRRIARCRLTRNRNVMVSFGGGELRVHEGYLAAPANVHTAIVAFVESRARTDRRLAQKVIVSYPACVPAPSARRERTHPDDEEIVQQLSEWHGRYDARHFGSQLRAVEIRVSRRMKARLGHYIAATPSGEAPQIAISRAHLDKHGWPEVLHTLLHEMVHQWQDETGRTIDHGATFRARARAIGIAPFARRVLATRPGRAQEAHSLARRAARSE